MSLATLALALAAGCASGGDDAAATATTAAASTAAGGTAAETYRVEDLGLLPGYDSGEAVAIAGSGRIAGNLVTGDRSRAFVHGPQGLVVIEPLPGDRSSHATALDAAGVVVGFSVSTDGATRAFVFDERGTAPIDPPARPGPSVAAAIDEAGRVAGSWRTPDGVRGFVWSPGGGARPLGTAPDGSGLVPAAMNDRGQVAGQTDSAVPSAFVATDVTVTLLPVPAPAFATGINDDGTVVGCRGKDSRAFVVAAGVVAWIEPLPPRGRPGMPLRNCALGVASNGDVVGYSDDRWASRHGDGQILLDGRRGFLHRRGATVALDDLLAESDAPWRILEARSIDDTGRIAATAWHPRTGYRAVRLVPAAR